MTTIFDVAFTDIGRFNINDLNTAIGAPTTLVVPADGSIGETAKLVAEERNLVIVLDRAEIVCGLMSRYTFNRCLHAIGNSLRTVSMKIF